MASGYDESQRDAYSAMSGTDSAVDLIAETAARIFGDLVTPAAIAQAEAGEWSASLWSVVAEAGLDRALNPESSGGIDASGEVAFAILCATGRAQAPIPLAETLIANNLASAAGLETPQGPLTLIEASASLRLERGNTLIGSAARVPWARHCKAALIAFMHDGAFARFAFATLDQPGVSIAAGDNAAGEPRDTIDFRNAKCEVGEAVSLTHLGRPMRAFGALARSAQVVGAIESVLEQSVRYAGERVQFGRPIGGFQAIQQQLAVLAGEYVAARMATEVAAAGFPQASKLDRFDAQRASSTLFDIAVAKIRSGDAATRAASIAHAVHGAIGFTREHRLNLATRRLWAWRADFGTESQWAAALGRGAITARADGFWPHITSHSLPLDLR